MAVAARSASMAALDDAIKRTWPGVVIGWIGNAAHQLEVSDHNPDDTPGVRAAQSDADTNPEVRGLDVMVGPSFTVNDGWILVTSLVDRPESRARLLYVIWQKRIWSRPDWESSTYFGEDPHTGHVHISGLAGDDENGARWGAVLGIGGVMSIEDVTDGLGTDVPYESPGVHTTAVAAGEGNNTSARRLIEYLIEHIRYGKPFVKRDGTVLLPHVSVDEIASPVLDQLASRLAPDPEAIAIKVLAAMKADTSFIDLIADAVAARISLEDLDTAVVAEAVARRLFGDRLRP